MHLLSPSLVAFMAVVEHQTVHAASLVLHLTQTAVTQRIRTLEKSLKTTLFIRSRKGMTLTPEGEALLRYCLAAKSLEGEALAHIQKTGVETEVTLSISASTSIMHSRIVPQCTPVLSDFPNLIMHFDVSDIENRQEKLRAGKADFIVIYQDDLKPEMAYKELSPEEYVLVCSMRWKGCRLKEMIQEKRIIDFDPSDRVTYEYLKHFNLSPNMGLARYFANRTEHLAQLVSAGLGYTTLTKEFAQPYVKTHDLYMLNQGKSMERSIVLAWYDRPEVPTYFKAVVDAIQ